MSDSKCALITGVNGQDGSYLAELLLSKGYKVYGMVRRHSVPNYKNISHLLSNKDFVLLDGDMTDHQSLSSVVKQSSPDEVYNLAAQSFVGVSFKEPLTTFDINAMGPLRLLHVIRDFNPKIHFYQASTSELFGLNLEAPQDENTPFHPASPYGLSKLLAHWTVVHFREAYGMFTCNGILFNHTSERRGIEFVTQKIADGVARIKYGIWDKIELGNLEAKRDWGYAPDYVEAMWMVLQHVNPTDFVIATGETHTVAEFVEEAFKVAEVDNWQSHIVTTSENIRPLDVPLLRGNAKKAETLLGWRPKTNFKELVKIMVEAKLEEYRWLIDNGAK